MTAKKTLAVRVHHTGGPEVLTVEEIDLPPPGPGEAQVRNEAVGLNFVEVYYRTGLYPRELPFVPGDEAAGVVTEVGQGVTGVSPGDRVVSISPGSYSRERNVPAAKLVKLPGGVSARDAAAVFLKGLTAEMLLFRIARVEAGLPILVHAAAGGAGSIIVRWAAALGCEVIGTVGSEKKAVKARADGCAHVLLYGREDVAARVREITDGKGVTAAFDSVGKATQKASLDSLAPRGWYIPFGNASGPPDPVAPAELARRGSLFMTRPTLFSYIAERGELEAASARLFDALAKGHVRAEIGRTYPLTEVAEAHRALEARETTGSTVLLP